MQYRKTSGFTIIEMLIGISIVVLLATITVFELRSTKRTDELNTAARQLVADIRGAQSRALAAKNIDTCDTGGADKAVCAISEAACSGNPCEADIPAAYGVHIESGTSTYILFADINPQAGIDYQYTDVKELYQTRSLLALGGEDVVIDQITSSSTSVTFADLAFMRQNGTVRFKADNTPPEPPLLLIRLRHIVSNQTAEIQINRITGRVSIL